MQKCILKKLCIVLKAKSTIFGWSHSTHNVYLRYLLYKFLKDTRYITRMITIQNAGYKLSILVLFVTVMVNFVCHFLTFKSIFVFAMFIQQVHAAQTKIRKIGCNTRMLYKRNLLFPFEWNFVVEWMIKVYQ